MRWPVGSFLQSCWACLEKVTSLWTETFFQSIDCKDTQEWSQLCFCNKHDRNCWKLVERGLHLKPEYQVSLFKTAFLFICSLIKEFILEKFPRLYPCIFSWANIKENEVITRYCLKLRCKFVKEIACFLQGGQFNDEIGTSNHYIWATSEMIKKIVMWRKLFKPYMSVISNFDWNWNFGWLWTIGPPLWNHMRNNMTIRVNNIMKTSYWTFFF